MTKSWVGWKSLQNKFLARPTHPCQPKSGTAHLSANRAIAQPGQRYSPVINLWIFLQESTSIPNCDVFLLREERLFSAAEWWRSCPRLNDVRSERASLQWFITSWVYERGAVWAVNDVLFYYYIWNISRLTCMLKRPLIKHGGPSVSFVSGGLLCQYRRLEMAQTHQHFN